MTNVDFLRDGKVGDRVHDIMLGNGVIKKLSSSMQYSIECTIEGYHASYTAEGRAWYDDRRPRLCWGHRGDLDQGKQPERFEYPLVMALSDSSLIVEFTDAKTATVLVATSASDPIGVIGHAYTEHTNTDCWKPCERPVWRPTKPTWCTVTNGSLQLVYCINPQGQYVDSRCHFWTEAEPCHPKDIPDWWPKEWI